MLRWDTAVAKNLLAEDASYVACLSPRCGLYFSIEGCGSKRRATGSKPGSASSPKNTDSIQAVCPYCEYTFCLSCNRPGHSGSCDDAKRREDNLSENTIKKLGAKPCPHCKVNIEKRGGCDHMTCNYTSLRAVSSGIY